MKSQNKLRCSVKTAGLSITVKAGRPIIRLLLCLMSPRTQRSTAMWGTFPSLSSTTNTYRATGRSQVSVSLDCTCQLTWRQKTNEAVTLKKGLCLIIVSAEPATITDHHKQLHMHRQQLRWTFLLFLTLGFTSVLFMWRQKPVPAQAAAPAGVLFVSRPPGSNN